MTIIDRIALAIDPEAWNPYCWGDLQREDQKSAQDKSLERAKQVLATIRSPTEEQVSAGVERVEYDLETGGLLGGADEAMHNVWTAMIDVALGGR